MAVARPGVNMAISSCNCGLQRQVHQDLQRCKPAMLTTCHLKSSHIKFRWQQQHHRGVAVGNRCTQLSTSTAAEDLQGQQRAHWAASVRQLTGRRKHQLWEPQLQPPPLLAQVCVVLVSPKRPVSVGTVARALSCFECTDFRVVQPRCDPLQRSGRNASKGAQYLLYRTREFDDVSSAVSDCQLSVAFARWSPNRPAQPKLKGLVQLMSHPVMQALLMQARPGWQSTADSYPSSAGRTSSTTQSISSSAPNPSSSAQAASYSVQEAVNTAQHAPGTIHEACSNIQQVSSSVTTSTTAESLSGNEQPAFYELFTGANSWTGGIASHARSAGSSHCFGEGIEQDTGQGTSVGISNKGSPSDCSVSVTVNCSRSLKLSSRSRVAMHNRQAVGSGKSSGDSGGGVADSSSSHSPVSMGAIHHATFSSRGSSHSTGSSADDSHSKVRSGASSCNTSIGASSSGTAAGGEGVAGSPVRVALVFGREEAGLLDAEVAGCDAVCAIPIGRLQESMSLSHAVTLALSHIFSQVLHSMPVELQAQYEAESRQQLAPGWSEMGVER